MQEKKLDEAPLVRCVVEAGVMIVTFDCAANGNALTVAMTEALSDVLESVALRRDVHCLLLRSSSKHFCTGGNVKDMQSGNDLMDGGIEQVRERLRSSLHRITRALGELEVPSICAVNGAAVGAGCDLALMCDMRVAGTRAVFAESFLRLGLVSGIGGAWFLSRIVGPAKALEMTLTSEFVEADEARRLGIVTNVYLDDELDHEAFALARRIASSPPLALRMAKKLVRESSHCTLSAALEMAANMQAILLCGSEHKQAVSTFLEQQTQRKAQRSERGDA